jgi:hypothetical protein
MQNPTPKRRTSPGSSPLEYSLAVRLILTLTLGLTLSPTARATDGVAEINHTGAVQTGCFAGDTAGYPVTLDGQAGSSYRLTSDLIVPNVDTSGIRITDDPKDIGIDLNNFAIIGVGCVGSVTNCTPTSGTGFGINGAAAFLIGISVKNGSIVGMGFSGVFLQGQAEITNLRVRWNRDIGIRAGPGSIVSGNTVFENGDDGISVSLGGVIVSGNTSNNNTGDGIRAGSGCLVHQNTVRSNGGFGLRLSQDAAFRKNVIADNTAGTIFGAGINMLANSCNGTATCP